MASSDTPSPPTGRVLAILDLLVASPTREFKLSELVAALGINKATCHSVVTTMVERGYLARSPRSLGFTLGAAVIVAGHAAEQANPAVQLARVVVPALADELGAECVASVVERDRITVVEWAPAAPPSGAASGSSSVSSSGSSSGSSWSHLGQHIPLIAPFGATQIAWSSAAEIEAWLDRSSASFDRDDLVRSLAAIRERGYDVQAESSHLDRFRATLATVDLDLLSASSREAVNQLMGDLSRVEHLPLRLDAAKTYDINALAAPVFGPTGYPVLTLSVHPSGPMRGRAVTAMGRRLRTVADEMTASIGGSAR